MSKAIIFFCFLVLYAAPLSAQQPDTVRVIQDTLSPAIQADSGNIAHKKSKLSADAGHPTADSMMAKPARKGWVNRFLFKKYPNPNAAALLGIVPGLGQVYNRKWWKVPIVYAGLGGIAYAAISTDKTYRALRDNYKWKVDLDPNTNPVDVPYVNMSDAQLKGYRDQFRGYTEKWYLFLGITYLLSITDAYVDAHMAHFDVSDDLTLKLAPAIQSGAGGFGPSFGIGIHIGLGRP